MVCFRFGEKVIYKFGASNPGLMKTNANFLVMWHAIKHAIDNNCTEFCFGRTEQTNVGLQQFKDGWGASQETANYYKYDLRKNAFSRGKKETEKPGNIIFRMLPMAVSRLTGSILYRHMG